MCITLDINVTKFLIQAQQVTVLLIKASFSIFPAITQGFVWMAY